MALFELQGPDGKMYEIEAPDVQSAATAFQEMAKPKAPASQPQLTAGETAMDIAKSFGIGVVQGGIGLATLPGNLEYLGRAGIDKAVTMLGYEDPQTSSNTLLPTYSDAKQFAEGYTGEFYKPQTTAGEYARTIGEFAPLAALGPGGAAARATNVLAPAVASETAGQLTEGSKYEPYARAAGALAGGMLPTVGMRTITPVGKGSDPTRAAHVANLEREGVTALTAGQRTGNRSLRWAEAAAADIAGASKKAESINTKAAEQFTAAALRRAGITAKRADGDTINAGFVELGKKFDQLAANNGIRVDAKLLQDIKNAVADYDSLVAPSQRAPIVQNIMDDLKAVATPGRGIAGDTYQATRSRLDRSVRDTKGKDPQLSNVLGNMRNALDDAMERSVKPADRGAWRQVRSQYKNLLAIEKASSGAGELAAAGLITPAQLRNAAKTQSPRAYARGKSDLGNLARSGEAVMKPLPQSGTAARTAYNNMFSAGGAAIGSAFLGAPGAAVGAIAEPVVKGLAARAMFSRPVQNYFSNRAVDDAITAYEGQRLNAFARLPQASNYFEASRGISGGMGPQYDENGNPLPGSRAEQELMRRKGAF